MNLDINLDMDAIRAEALKAAREKSERLVHAAITKLFHDGSYWEKSKGAGYLAIEQQIDDLICGPEIEAQTRRIIDEKFGAILEREIEYQLTRRAQKLAAIEIKNRRL